MLDLIYAAAAVLSEVELPERAVTEARLERMAERLGYRLDEAVEASRAAGTDPKAAMAHAMGRLVFDELGFVRHVSDEEVGYSLLPVVIEQRQGSCLGLGTLVLALAERHRLPVRLVMAPGHVFARMGPSGGGGHPGHYNLELLRRAELMPDAWYRRRYGPVAGVSAYMRPLDEAEVVGLVAYNIGNALRARGDAAQALRLYETATRLFASFAEAHANQGLMLQRVGRVRRARAAYERAMRLHPMLPGLATNLRALPPPP